MTDGISSRNKSASAASRHGPGGSCLHNRPTGIEPGSDSKSLAEVASPDQIQFAPSPPKTRSGKFMRRILRKIAEDEPGSVGDTSTLADPAVVDDLVKYRRSIRAS